MNSSNLGFLWFLAIILFFSSLGDVAVAQTRHSNDNSLKLLLNMSIEDLLSIPIDTTSFFTEHQLDTVSSVSVINKQNWQQRGARQLHDAYLTAPGLAALPNFLGSYGLFIRGYAQADARGIATLWDGVPITSFNLGTATIDRPNIQLSTLDKIEIIRGPGSALYGADAFHGTISLQAFESQSNVSEIDAGMATNGYYTTAIRHSHPLHTNTRINLALGLSGQPDQEQQYAYTDPISSLPAVSERKYQYQSQTMVLKLTSNPEAEVNYNIGFYHDYHNQDGFHGQGEETITDDVSDVDSLMNLARITLTKKFTSNQSIKFIGYGWKQKHDFSRPLANGNQIDIFASERRQGADLIYRDSKLLDHTELSVAIGYRHEEMLIAERTITDPLGAIVLDLPLLFSGKNRSINSYLIDGKSTIIPDDWIMRYGVRLDNYSNFGHQLTPRIGLIYKNSDSSALKLSYGNAFRAPTANEVAGTPFISGDPNINPETIDTYEMAYITTGDLWKYEFILFKTTWSDSITNISNQFVNAGENNSYGLEFSYYHKFDQLLVDSNITYVKSRNQQDDYDYSAFPQTIINAGFGYHVSQDLDIFINNRLHFNVDDGSRLNNNVPRPLKNYWRTDLNIDGIVLKDLSIYLAVRNLFDRENYLPSMINAEGGIEEPGIEAEVGIRWNI